MSPLDPRTRDNPEAAMLHQPSAAFFDLPRHRGLDGLIAMRSTPKWAEPSASEPVAKPEPGTLPGFDSEAHRAFMRGLG